MTSIGFLVLAVSTGVVVIVVAVCVVLIVLLVTLAMRGQQKQGAQRRREARRDLDAAQDRAVRAEHERDVEREGTEDLGPDR